MKDDRIKGFEYKGHIFYKDTCNHLGDIFISFDKNIKGLRDTKGNISIDTRFVIFDDPDRDYDIPMDEDTNSISVFVDHSYEVESISEYLGVAGRIGLTEIMFAKYITPYLSEMAFYFDYVKVNVLDGYGRPKKKFKYLTDFENKLCENSKVKYTSSIEEKVLIIDPDTFKVVEALTLVPQKGKRLRVNPTIDLGKYSDDYIALIDIGDNIFTKTSIGKLRSYKSAKLERFTFTDEEELKYRYMSPEEKLEGMYNTPVYKELSNPVDIAIEKALFHFHSKLWEESYPKSICDFEVLSRLRIKRYDKKDIELISGTFEPDNFNMYSPYVEPKDRIINVVIP